MNKLKINHWATWIKRWKHNDIIPLPPHPLRPVLGGVSAMYERGRSLQPGGAAGHPSDDGRRPRWRDRGGGEHGGTNPSLPETFYLPSQRINVWMRMLLHAGDWEKTSSATTGALADGVKCSFKDSNGITSLLAQWQKRFALIDIWRSGDLHGQT